jgi:polysaccharide deacetylase family protein (PEP-CTERM system associated)
MLNALTIDVEDYFQVHAFSDIIGYEDWGKFECRVERNTHRILDLLNGSLQTPNGSICNPVTATFFCLGWIAERYPKLIKEIHSQGHEIACHGYAHQLIYHHSREEFREDIHKAKTILEDITGNEVIGYRAPSYSITEKSLWALEILIEEGFKYDSSIFPIRHDFYGFPSAPRFPFMVSFNGNGSPEFMSLIGAENLEPRTLNLEPRNPNAFLFNPKSEIGNPQSIVEFPISTVRLGRFNIPLSGGGYFRLLPYSLVKSGLKRLNAQERKPFIFYLHPWEFDPDQPRIQGTGMKSKFRHYLNLDKTETRFKNLLSDFQFSSVRKTIGLFAKT